jgi:prevent-host-death family protein
MKVMSAHEAKNRFGELLDTVQRQPVVITKNGRAVGVMISMEDAADTVLPEMLVDKEPDHDSWLLEKVSATMRLVDNGEIEIFEHEEAMKRLRGRLKEHFGARAD